MSAPAFPPVPLVDGVVAPLLRDNVDTDAIIPSREIRGVGRTGLADGLFAGWRYRPGPGTREPDPDFVLNRPAYADAPILLSGSNFGCGSSREHAVWALHEHGIRAVIAESFAPIFRANCIANGIVPVALPKDALAAVAQAGRARIDVPALTVEAGAGRFAFPLDAEAQAMLTEGLDAIDLTMKRAADIAAFHAADRAARPWIYLT